jgi:hypothetical protein
MFELSVSGHRAPEDVSLILGRPGAAALSPWAGCVECPANSAWTRAPCPALSPRRANCSVALAGGSARDENLHGAPCASWRISARAARTRARTTSLTMVLSMVRPLRSTVVQYMELTADRGSTQLWLHFQPPTPLRTITERPVGSPLPLTEKLALEIDRICAC